MEQRKILSGWKEIAEFLGRGVRTVQRWEAQYSLPIHRPAGKDRAAVGAFADEIVAWLNRSNLKEQRYVRPTLVVIEDQPDKQSLSNRKLGLEMAKFNVLTAFTATEALATANRMDVHGFVMQFGNTPDIDTTQLCEELKELYPEKPIFVVAPANEVPPRCANHVIRSDDPAKLVEAVIQVFGQPQVG